LRIYLDCYECFIRQVLRAGKMVEAPEEIQYIALQQVLLLMQNIPVGSNPAEISSEVQRIIFDVVTHRDHFLDIKRLSTQQALTLYPRLKKLVKESNDPLAMAIRLSIAGNIIDYGVTEQIPDLWMAVENAIRQPYAIDNTNIFYNYLAKADHILYLADNVGETVFDRLLIEVLPVPVTYVVKSGPMVNDAILEDAVAAGIDSCARIISSGAQVVGTVFSKSSVEFLKEFETAPLIISKGQANFETLSECDPKIFCFFQVKCPVIGRHLSSPVGSLIVRQCGSRSNDLLPNKDRN